MAERENTGWWRTYSGISMAGVHKLRKFLAPVCSCRCSLPGPANQLNLAKIRDHTDRKQADASRASVVGIVFRCLCCVLPQMSLNLWRWRLGKAYLGGFVVNTFSLISATCLASVSRPRVMDIGTLFDAPAIPAISCRLRWRCG